MNLQYFSDSQGKVTGVYLPIEIWNEFKSKYEELSQLEHDIPDWQKEISRKSLMEYKADPFSSISAQEALDKYRKKKD